MPKLRLLIADDHPLIAEGLRAILDSEFEIEHVVGDGREVVSRVVETKPDGAILDISMPGLNGIQAARQLKKVSPETKVVFLTQYGDWAYVRAAFQANASGYCWKQSAASDIVPALREVFRGRLYISPALRDNNIQSLLDPNNIQATGSDELTPRQREVLQLVAEGRTGKEIASTLGISVKTVEFHKNALMEKTGLRTTAQLTRFAIEHGLVTLTTHAI